MSTERLAALALYLASRGDFRRLAQSQRAKLMNDQRSRGT